MFDTITVHVYFAPPKLADTLDDIATQLTQLTERIIMDKAELEVRLGAAADKQEKILAEVQASTAALRAEIAAQGTVSAAAEAALLRLEGLQTTTDDLNPDAPAGEVVAP